MQLANTLTLTEKERNQALMRDILPEHACMLHVSFNAPEQ